MDLEAVRIVTSDFYRWSLTDLELIVYNIIYIKYYFYCLIKSMHHHAL